MYSIDAERNCKIKRSGKQFDFKFRGKDDDKTFNNREEIYIFFSFQNSMGRNDGSTCIRPMQREIVKSKEVEGNDSISNFEAEKAKQRWRKWFIWRRPLIPDV